MNENEKKNYKVHIPDFVEWELQYFRDNCNFLEDEREYFELRSSGMSNVEISMTMNVSESKVSKLARKVKSKILRVI